MARAATVGALGLSPFGAGGSSFDAFSVGTAQSEKAYLNFRKIEVQWEAGQIDNAAYLAALRTYAAALKANTSEKVSAEARVKQYTERFDRDAIEQGIAAGTKTKDDLLAFDQAHLAGINAASEEYQSRVAQINSDQNDIFNDLQQKQQDLWSEGKMTTAQLMAWYQGLPANLTENNRDLTENVARTLASLSDRVVSERDSKMLTDFANGKVDNTTFMAYAAQAQARYQPGTTQYDDWTNRIEDAKDKATETPLLYRYDLSQRYAQLEQFVKQNGAAPKAGSSTSTSTRVVWNGTKWVTVKTTTTKAGSLSASSVKAYHDLQVQVADAKKQMAELAKQIARQPGGFVTTAQMISFYTKVQGRYAVGSQEWYAIQSKLDGYHSQLHAEQVLAKQGIKITYPKVGSSSGGGSAATSAAKVSSSSPSRASGDGNISIDAFMRAIASVESGGRYDATNKSSGAYGKYQIMPSNWPGWAGKYLGNRNAQPTPENQEKVARAKMLELYKWLGDWRAVAAWWLNGGSDKKSLTNSATWAAGTVSYVNKVFGKLGASPTKITGTASGTGGTSAGGGGRVVATTTKPGAPSTISTTAAPAGTRNPLNFPKGYDGRAYENFYQAYMQAWKRGDETFTDYSSGQAVTYFIPLDPGARADLAWELDQRRIDYYNTKAQAYLNPDGTPTSAAIEAANQASGATKDAIENHLTSLDFAPKPGTEKPKPTSAGAAGRNDTRHFTDTVESLDAQGNPTGTLSAGVLAEGAGPSSNPLAKAQVLSAKLDAQLKALAAAAKRAYDAGQFALAYSLTQQAGSLVLQVKPALDYYTQVAGAEVAAGARAGATVPSAVKGDLARMQQETAQLAGSGTSSDTTTQSLALLEEVSGNLDTILLRNPDGSPKEAGGDVVLKPNVTLLWKNGKLEIDTASSSVGWSTPTTAVIGKGNTVQAFGVKSGNSVMGNVQVEYTTGVVGFINGNENYPVYGKIVSGVDANGRPYQWAENPMTGGWSDITTQPLNFKTPKSGFQAVQGAPTTGTTGIARPSASPMDYQFTGSDGGTYRMVYDSTDGKYALYQSVDGPLGSAPTWQPVGKVGGGKNDDLRTLLTDSGWGLDTTGRTGDTAIFTDLLGPVIGISGTDWRDLLNNTGSATPAGQPTWDHGWSGAGDQRPAAAPRTPRPFERPAGSVNAQRNIDKIEGASGPTVSPDQLNIGAASGTSVMYAKPTTGSVSGTQYAHPTATSGSGAQQQAAAVKAVKSIQAKTEASRAAARAAAQARARARVVKKPPLVKPKPVVLPTARSNVNPTRL